MNRSLVCLVAAAAALLVVSSRNAATDPPGNVYVQRNLVSDLRGQAKHVDDNLVNPWGIAFSPTGPFWIADNHTGFSTVYDTAGHPFPLDSPLIVTIPPPTGGMPPAAPTGIVFNGTQSFLIPNGRDRPGKPAVFIFATEDGTISGWISGTSAVLEVDKSASGAVYKGLAIGNNGSGDFLYATNFHAGTVDVYNSTFGSATLPGSFTDTTIPAGFAPFGIQNIGGKLYVTYALQNAEKHDDVAGPGNGYVNVFDLNGNLVQRLISGGSLNSPWGLAPAPGSFGDFGGSLLVGNFGDGRINAFDPATGAQRGTLLRPSGQPITIQGLWGLIFGNGGLGGKSGVLYFTAGIPGPPPGKVEDHGLFGLIRPRHGDNDDENDNDNGNNGDNNGDNNGRDGRGD